MSEHTPVCDNKDYLTFEKMSKRYLSQPGTQAPGVKGEKERESWFKIGIKPTAVNIHGMSLVL